MPLSPSERHLRSQIAAHTSWANTEDRVARTAPARAALDQKFLDLADGDPVRAEHLRIAHFKRLALKSAQVRRRRREAAAQIEAITAEIEAIEALDVELAELGADDDAAAGDKAVA